SLPGQGPHDLPILGAEMGVGLQPALAALLVLAQLPLVIVGPVDLLGGNCQPPWYVVGLVVTAAQPAKHARRLTAAGPLVSGQVLLGLLAVGGGPGQLPGAVAGGLVEPGPQPAPLGPPPGRSRSARNSAVDSRPRSGLLGVSMANLWPPARDRAWASCR